MIYGNINDLTQMELLSKDPKLKVAFDYLRKGNFEGAEKSIYLEEGVKVTSMKVEAPEFDINNFETHINFTDIHYVIDGQEEIYLAPANTLEVKKEYNPERDVEFGRCENSTHLIMKKGDYCITFPEDAHRPCCGHGNILEKIVFKVPAK